MDPNNGNQIAIVALMLSLSGTVFNLPWLHASDVKDGCIDEVHRGEWIAGTIVVSSGIMMSFATKSRMPFFIACLMTAVYCAGIEYTTKQNASK